MKAFNTKVIAISNQKGGVGKTTSAVNIASFLAITETPTLIIDMDPQANASTGLGVDVSPKIESVYDILIKGYTTKQWGRDPSKLPASIIKRLPIRRTYDNRYFNDKYQGIPIGGYTQIFEKLLEGIDVFKGFDYLDDIDLKDIADFENKIIDKCSSEKSEIIDSILSSGKLDEDAEKKLIELITNLKKTLKS